MQPQTETWDLPIQINNRNVDKMKYGLQSVPDNSKVKRDKLFNKIASREGTRRRCTI
jgi:hypothetical protein